MSRHCHDRLGWCAAGLLMLVSGCASVPPGPSTSGAAVSLPGDYAAAQTLMEAGRFEQAVPVLESLAHKHPQHANPLVNLAIARRALQQPDAAMEAVQRALQLQPDSAEALHQLGLLERERGDFKAAADAYAQALQQRPDYALAHRNLGILLDLYLQQPAQALPHYRRYLELSATPDDAVAGWILDLERRVVARTQGGA